MSASDHGEQGHCSSDSAVAIKQGATPHPKRVSKLASSEHARANKKKRDKSQDLPGNVCVVLETAAKCGVVPSEPGRSERRCTVGLS